MAIYSSGLVCTHRPFSRSFIQSKRLLRNVRQHLGDLHALATCLNVSVFICHMLQRSGVFWCTLRHSMHPRVLFPPSKLFSTFSAPNFASQPSCFNLSVRVFHDLPTCDKIPTTRAPYARDLAACLSLSLSVKFYFRNPPNFIAALHSTNDVAVSYSLIRLRR